MSRLRPPAAVAATITIAVLTGPPAALAIAGAPGGSEAPAPSTTTTTTQAAPETTPSGLPATPEPSAPASPAAAPAGARGPSVAALNVPTTATAGPPPRITVEVEDQVSSTVYVHVSLDDLTARTTALVAWLGWIRTGRTVTVRWPAGVKLPAGSYRAVVSGHDRHNLNMLRNAHSSGEAGFQVVAPAPTPSTGASPAGEAGVPSPAETVADGAIFPVSGTHNFGGPENVFGAPRDGYLHQGQDILTAEGTPILAPLAGTVLTTNYQASGAGYYAVEQTAIGFDFMFAHCEPASLLVTAGETLAAGQQLCSAGQTGDATAPHLDFEMWVGGWQTAAGHPINPLPYLEAWERA